MIRTKQLHIGYDRTLLEVDDLELQTGRVYILVGKNGSGKSTFLKTISGQLSPLSGDVFIEEKSMRSVSTHHLPRMVSFVATRFPVVEYLRVEEFLGLARNPYTNFFGTLKSSDKQKAAEALEVLHIEQLKTRYTSELSDGERQLVAIAKSLAQETPVILLDEPTAFLDYSNKQRVLSTLLDVAERFQKCVILSSHDLDMSLESGGQFLVVNAHQKKLELAPKNISKAELIEKAF